MVYPLKSSAPLASKDMPGEILPLYDEARNIYLFSPRSTAALLRLVIQKLCVYLGGKGHNVNEDISYFVTKGLPEKIQKSLDIVRVVGNNAVHPGTINFDDDEKIALKLFKLINIIIDNMISQPKEIDSLYEKLPEESKKAIEKRDAN